MYNVVTMMRPDFEAGMNLVVDAFVRPVNPLCCRYFNRACGNVAKTFTRIHGTEDEELTFLSMTSYCSHSLL